MSTTSSADEQNRVHLSETDPDTRQLQDDWLGPDCKDVLAACCHRYGLSIDRTAVEFSADAPLAQQIADTVDILEQALVACEEDLGRLSLLRALASLYHGPAGSPELAFARCTEILDIDPHSDEAFDRMERIDESAARHDRLVDTLIARCQVCPQPQRVALHARVARLAELALGDIDLACEHFRDAVELDPANEQLREEASRCFERAQRSDAFTQLLLSRADEASEGEERVALLRSAAERLTDTDDETAAQDAWERAVELRPAVETLQGLVSVLERRTEDGSATVDTSARLEQRMGELARLVVDDDFPRAHELQLQRASVLATQLDDAPGAYEVLRDAAEQCEQSGDRLRLANTLTRQLQVRPDAPEAAATARDAYALLVENGGDPGEMVQALSAWCAAEPGQREPHERLLPLLEEAGDVDGQIRVLDALAALSSWDEAAAHALRAAELARDELMDGRAAWTRLAPLVLQGFEPAQRAIETLAELCGRFADLGALYVAVARSQQQPARALHWWSETARAFERAEQPKQALEATLRALACDLSRQDILAEAERLADACGDCARLGPVYDRLVQESQDPATKLSLLERHVHLLRDRLQDPAAALSRACVALRLSPQSAPLLEQAEELARQVGSVEPVCDVYESEARRAESAEETAFGLLACAIIAARHAGATARAEHCLAGAASAAAHDDDLLQAVQVRLVEHQEARAEPESEPAHAHVAEVDLRDLWAPALEHTASKMKDARERDAALARRAAEWTAQQMGDGCTAFEILQRGMDRTQRVQGLLDTMVDVSERFELRQRLEAFLQAFAASTMRGDTEQAVLRRLAHSYEVSGNEQGLLVVYQRLFMLAPEDEAVAEALCTRLAEAERYHDLLLVLHQRLQRADTKADMLLILREAARTWEFGLKSRFESIDAWRRVLALRPSDGEADAALQRLTPSAQSQDPADTRTARRQ